LRQPIKGAEVKEESIFKAFVTQRNDKLVTHWGKCHAYTDTEAHTC